KKTKKDPDSPKRPITSFMFFNKYKIDDYKKKNPGKKINVTLISKESGEEWKKLKDNEKDKYIKMANKDKKRYEKEISLY
ncbi:high mobility group protein 1, related, partial [Lichtheimia hyalospora FSU 10163]